jgi:hypothetical protein
LLVEPQRTNLALWSEQFDNAYWTKNASSVTANSVISPDGTQDADTLTANGLLNFHSVMSSAVSVTTTATTLSIYAKKNTNDFIQLAVTGGIGGMYANFNIATGVVGSVGTTSGSNPTSSIQSMGNGWYRCSMTFTPTVATTTNVYCALAASATDTRLLANTLSTSVYLYGAQLEAGAYPTSYIPTTSASVTRNADIISKTGISSLIGQTEGTILIDFVLKNPISATNRMFSLTESNWSSGGSIYINAFNNKFNVDIVNAGASVATIDYSFTPQQNTRYKIAVAYKLNDCKMYVNGVDAGSDTSTSAMPTCSELYLNALGGGFNAPYEASNINVASLWKTRLTNAELAQLTTI